MGFLNKLSLKRKLTWIIMLTCSSALLIVCFSFAIYEVVKFRSDTIRELSSLAQVIESNSTAPLEFGDQSAGMENLRALRSLPNIIAARIFDRNGNAFATYHHPEAEITELPLAPKNDGDHFSGDILSLYHPIRFDGQRVGTLLIQSDLHNLNIRLRQYALILGFVLLASLLTAYFMSAALQKSVSKPILHLAEVADHVSTHKDYSTRIEKVSQDEVGHLIERFNEMLVHIQNSEQELYKAYGELEKRVFERTRQLNEAKEEAEDANRAKSEFLSRISHELRTPMNAILGFSQLMEMDMDDPLSESHQERLNEILKAGNHLLELINEVLDLSRIEAGKLTLSIEDVDVKKVLEETLTLILPMAEKKGISVQNNIEDNTFVRADHTKFKQVLLNLLSNAVKYNVENGSVILNIENTGDGRVRIFLKDTGNGLTQEQQDTIFEPFNRLDADQTEIEGTGIGLTITRRLMDLMDGSIDITSAPGKGSTFTLEFKKGEETPHSETLAVSHSNRAETDSPLKQHKVLYVEDNPANLALVEQLLKPQKNIELLKAPQAQIGIDLARAHRPDLILMDINLPEMDGIEAFKRLQAHEETRNIPVIAVSANAMESDIKKAHATGFCAYITKPFVLKIFLDEVNRILNLTAADGQINS